MKFIISPQAFKGTLRPWEAAKQIEAGVKSVFPQAECFVEPIADGGNGTLDVLLKNGKKRFKKEIRGPLGDLVEAEWGINQQGIAVIESAEACGLHLISEDQKNPLNTSTYGVGELIKEALNQNCQKIIVGVGGSATNDGGAGMAYALGAKFLDEQGSELIPSGLNLKEIKALDLSSLDSRLKNCSLVAACDVENPLLGKNGATKIFAKQKGANPEMIKDLEEGLRHLSTFATDVNCQNTHMGAGGGLAFGLQAFLGAKLYSGAELVLDTINFSKILKRDVLYLITGEGCIDHQSLQGKAPIALARRAQAYDIPVLYLAGSLGRGYSDVFEQGVRAIYPIVLNLKKSTEHMMQTCY